MNCTEARERILEADLAELRETGDLALSKHVRLCAQCRAMAERVVRDELALGRSLAALHPRVDIERALSVRHRAFRARLRIWTRFVPALAAAGLVGVLISRIPIVPAPRGTPFTVPAEALPRAPMVEPPSDRNVVVFETDNPNIVIIWFY